MAMHLSNEDRIILREALLAVPEFTRNPRRFFADALGGGMAGVLETYTGWAQDATVVASELLNRVKSCEIGKGIPAIGYLAWAVHPLVGSRHRARLRGLCKRMAWPRPPRPRGPRPLPGFSGRALGNYDVGERIGQGNFAVVYRATHRATNQVVALKILKDRSRNPIAELLLPNIGHPRVLQPLATPGITGDGYTFFPVRLMHQSLRDLMRKAQNAKFAWEEGARLVLEVARALVDLHQGDHGILHQDLKPENILLDKEGNPHIADLGLAVPLRERHSEEMRNRAAGTWPYMAPELFRKVYHSEFPEDPKLISVDGKADIFSLGVVLYELLTGEHPWGGDWDSRRENLDLPPSSVRQKLPLLSAELDSLCLDCLAPRLDRRINSAKTLVERLERLLPSQPPPPLPRESELRYLDLLLTEFQRIEESAKSYCALEGKADIRLRHEAPPASPAITSGIFRYDLGLCVQLARAPESIGEHTETRQREYPDILRAFFDPAAGLTRVVLLGGPGSGKSTTLRRLAQELATDAQNDLRAPVPLFVSLRAWTGIETLEEFAATEISGAVPGFGVRIRAPHASRPFVLLLDEWNQIPAEGRKERRLSLLSFVGSFASSRSGAKVVVSCREDDYRGDLHLGFDTLTLKPLTPTRILDTLRHWLPGTPDRAETLFWQLAGSMDLQAVFEKWRRGGASLDEFFSVEKPTDHQGAYAITSGNDDALWMQHVPAPHSLMKLAANPFMLWMLFSAWWNSPTLTLPRNRAELLTGFVHHLLFREGLLEAADSGNHRVTPQGELLLRGLTSLAWETFGVETPGLAEFSRAQARSAFMNKAAPEDAEYLL
jgi:serine/threonine protein kinase